MATLDTMKSCDISEVFVLLGILHQEQADLFSDNLGINIALPGFDLEDYDVRMIKHWIYDSDDVETGREVVVGLIVLKPSGYCEHTMTLCDIVLYPEYRGMGIGTDAMRQLCWEFQNGQYTFMNLNVMAENKVAVKLYEKCGFKPASIMMVRETWEIPENL